MVTRRSVSLLSGTGQRVCATADCQCRVELSANARGRSVRGARGGGQAQRAHRGTWGAPGAASRGCSSADRGCDWFAETGAARNASMRIRPEKSQVWPSFLPDGRSFVFTQWSRDVSNRGIFLGQDGIQPHDPDRQCRRQRTSDRLGASAVQQEQRLMAAPFDLQTEPSRANHDRVTTCLCPAATRGSRSCPQMPLLCQRQIPKAIGRLAMADLGSGRREETAAGRRPDRTSRSS